MVGFLKRMLQQRTDSITELTDRLEGMKVRVEQQHEKVGGNEGESGVAA